MPDVDLDFDDRRRDEMIDYAARRYGDDRDTLGVFQLDSGGMRTLLRLMQPTLYRPGPMEMNAHTNYALRKTGKQKVEPIHPELADALEPILGHPSTSCGPTATP